MQQERFTGFPPNADDIHSLGLGLFLLMDVAGGLDFVLHVLDAFLEFRDAFADSPGNFGQAAAEDQDGDDQDDDPLGPAGETHECKRRMGHSWRPLWVVRKKY